MDASRTVAAPFAPLTFALTGGAIIAAITILNGANAPVYVYPGYSGASNTAPLFTVAANLSTTVPISAMSAITFAAPAATAGNVYAHIVDTPLTAQSSSNIFPAVRSNLAWSAYLPFYANGAEGGIAAVTIKPYVHSGSPPSVPALQIGFAGVTANNPAGAHFWLTDVSCSGLAAGQFFIIGNTLMVGSTSPYALSTPSTSGFFIVPGANGHASFSNPIDLGAAVYSGAVGGNLVALTVWLANPSGTVNAPDAVAIALDGYAQ